MSIAGAPVARVYPLSWVAAAGLLAAAAGWSAAASPPAATHACDPQTLAQAKSLWQAARYAEADSVYLSAIGRDSTCAAALWGATMARIDESLDQPQMQLRRQLLLGAVQLARQAVDVAPEDTWTHLYLGAALGRLAMTEGTARRIELSRAIRVQADLALAADTTNARAHHLLGMWHREVASLGVLTRAAAKVVFGGVPSGASKEAALAHFERAIALEPQRINHHLECARTLAQVDRIDDALTELRRIVSLPSVEPRDPQYRAEALALRRQLLTRMKSEGRGRAHDR